MTAVLGRALVTGAAGFVGSNLAVDLASDGWEVVGLDDFCVGSFKNLADFSGDVVTADLADGAAWTDRVGEVDAVFHQAANTDTTVTDQAKMMRQNVEAFRVLLAWAAKTGVKKVVYASSAGVYGDGPVPMRETAAPRPLNVYALSKRVMESVAREFSDAHPKIDLVGLRYFNVYGQREAHKGAASSMIWQLFKQMKAGKRPRLFEFGDQYRDFVYVKDVVRANRLAASRKVRGVFNVCTGKKATFNEIVANLNDVLRTRLEPDYFKNPYSFYQNETLGDPGLAARELKFAAQFDIEKGIRDYLGGKNAPVGV